MQYTASDGLSLYGRYTIGSGEMKYSLPVIPLKTFTIKDGSYAEFSGDPMNPRLNITATEEKTVTDISISSVVKVCCGVGTNTLVCVCVIQSEDGQQDRQGTGAFDYINIVLADKLFCIFISADNNSDNRLHKNQSFPMEKSL